MDYTGVGSRDMAIICESGRTWTWQQELPQVKALEGTGECKRLKKAIDYLPTRHREADPSHPENGWGKE